MNLSRFNPASSCARGCASLVLAAGISAAVAADYHVNAQAGDDARDGRSPETAWRSLDKASAAALNPGDRLLLRAGSRWSGQLRIQAQGAPGRPIRIGTYGEGARPRIDAEGAFEDALLIRNAQHIEVSGFELTNLGQGDKNRRGVNIVADNAGTLTHIVVRDLYIHDVNGTQKRKDNGGLFFRMMGERVPSRYDDLRIERNIIWKVDRSGIAAQSYHASRSRWFPSTNVVIRDNWIGDVGGDGIVPWATDGVLVEHNIVQDANMRAKTYNAGIWPWSTDNTVMRLNRASGVRTLMDGQGFDSDYNSRNTLLEYNLSHDNEGGFLLICTPGNRKPRENIGNLGTIARYNISRNDRARTFHVTAAENTLVHDNAIYIGRDEVQCLLLSDWSGWAKGLVFSNNLFTAEGKATYGYQTSRSQDGSYGIAPGWGPAKDVAFRGNRFLGNHVNKPEDTAPNASAPQPVSLDWPGPQFNPAKPETFAAYIDAHREWMLRLMERQFGKRPAVSK